MKHNNISIFIPHVGCKNECSFCNQRIISGTIKPPTANDVRETLQKAFTEISDKSTTEIAFFGGSFTAIERQYMLELLQVANEFIGKDKFSGIRVSTRPDAISVEILDLLKQYNVTAIELGAQSMDDDVLMLNNRGHCADDVDNASLLIKSYGFSLGLQMMIGLYGDTVQGAYYTCERIIALKPDTVRIYPTVILKGTKLESLYLSRLYKVLPFDVVISVCADLLTRFNENNINVIKLGLHASQDIEKDMVGGIYHPAFRELCEGEIFLRIAIIEIIKQQHKNICIFVNKSCVSKMVGHKKKNIEKFKKMGYNVRVASQEGLSELEIIVKKDVQPCY